MLFLLTVFPCLVHCVQPGGQPLCMSSICLHAVHAFLWLCCGIKTYEILPDRPSTLCDWMTMKCSGSDLSKRLCIYIYIELPKTQSREHCTWFLVYKSIELQLVMKQPAWTKLHQIEGVLTDAYGICVLFVHKSCIDALLSQVNHNIHSLFIYLYVSHSIYSPQSRDPKSNKLRCLHSFAPQPYASGSPRCMKRHVVTLTGSTLMRDT